MDANEAPEHCQEISQQCGFFDPTPQIIKQTKTAFHQTDVI